EQRHELHYEHPDPPLERHCLVPGVEPEPVVVEQRTQRCERASIGRCLGRCNYISSSGIKTLVLHWDGTAWSKVKSPNPSTDNSLTAVSARASSDAWAIGYSCPCGGGLGHGGHPPSLGPHRLGG